MPYKNKADKAANAKQYRQLAYVRLLNLEWQARYRARGGKKSEIARIRSSPERLRRWLAMKRAHRAVGYALFTGKITRPLYCSLCLAACKPEAHHQDYNKPLEIVWLCTVCHGGLRWWK